jgi:transcriptional regulator with XRE-family HTH domain
MADGYDLGKRIRQRREELSLSLRELARRTDLTASFLSQVEHSQANPSISSLRRLTEALDVTMLYFLVDGPEHDPVVRADNRARISFANSKLMYELLTPDLSGKFEVMQGRIGPGADNIVRPLRQETEECILVLSGSLDIGLASEHYILNPGDSITFKGNQLHSMACESKEDAQWISIIAPPAF